MSLSTHLADIYLEELEKVLALPEDSDVSVPDSWLSADTDELAQMPSRPTPTTTRNLTMPHPHPNGPLQTPRLGIQTHNFRPHYRPSTVQAKYDIPTHSVWMLCR